MVMEERLRSPFCIRIFFLSGTVIWGYKRDIKRDKRGAIADKFGKIMFGERLNI